MKRSFPDPSMLATARSTARRSDAAAADEEREQRMAELVLSAADTCFLRTLHQTEKRLNEAFDAGRQTGDLQQRVSQVYKQLYRPD